jgi:hypothetical protein
MADACERASDALAANAVVVAQAVYGLSDTSLGAGVATAA